MYRERRGWTLAQVAEMVGLQQPSAVWKHEQGRTMPKPDVLRQYARITQGAVTADDFINAVQRHRAARREPVPEAA